MYVWVIDNEGNARFTDDKYLDPCPVCGELVGACQMADKCGTSAPSFEEED